MSTLKSIFELREMLHEMERDIGLEGLSRAECDVLLAANDLTEAPGEIIGSGRIRSHRLVTSMAQATFQRALKALVEAGLLERPEGSKSKSYVVCGTLTKN
jgi:DNA-binding transcriptional ArsR family regulator